MQTLFRTVLAATAQDYGAGSAASLWRWVFVSISIVLVLGLAFSVLSGRWREHGPVGPPL